MSLPVLADVRYTTNTLPNSVASFHTALEYLGIGDILAEGLFHVEQPYAMFYMVPPQEPEYQSLLKCGGFSEWSESVGKRLPIPDQITDIWYEIGQHPKFRRLWLVCDIQEGDWPMMEHLVRNDCRTFEKQLTLILPNFLQKPTTKLDVCCPDPESRIRLESGRSLVGKMLDKYKGKMVLDLESGDDFILKKVL